MSNRYKGGVISATPPTLVAGAGASGAWTLEQQMQATAAGLWPVNGPFYIEEVFSTWLYTGNGSAQGINNGIDLIGKGGMVWIKDRTTANSHAIFDTNRGTLNYLSSNTTSAQGNSSTTLSSFSSDGATAPGFFVRSNVLVGTNGDNYASWTFRKQPKFFDVVTYTGNGTGQTINHNLGSVPGCIIIKATGGGASSGVTNWAVYHRSLGNTDFAWLNSTAAKQTSSGYWNNTTPTSTQFTVGSTGNVNESGASFVAYVFAHDAGGFGLTGTDNVISCGSVTDNNRVELGYEPQFLLLKTTSTTGNWILVDTMRGLASGTSDGNATLFPNTSGAEASGSRYANIDATGFTSNMGSPGTHIYIAIRRGPMKVPTSGTSVLGLNARSGTGANATVTGGAGVTDLAIIKRRDSTSSWIWVPRLNGQYYLSSNLTSAEGTGSPTVLQANPWDVMDGVKVGTTSTTTNNSGGTYINYLIDRAPSFMDVVCYTGTGSTQTISHNLQAVPELIITKNRTNAGPISQNWCVYAPGIPNNNNVLFLNTTSAWYDVGAAMWNGTPTSTTFGVAALLSPSTDKMVAYLFATCAGVSKVGSYTGTGATQTIDCGFTGGARFVLIKRTDQTADWFVWDTARGMVAGTDPRLTPNTTAAELNNNWVYTSASGFQIVTVDSTVNGNGGTYIFLAIA